MLPEICSKYPAYETRLRLMMFTQRNAASPVRISGSLAVRMTYAFMQPMQQKKRSLSPMHCFRGYLPHPRPQRSHARVVSTSLMGVLRLLHRGIAVLIEEDRVRAFRDYITEDEDS